MPAPVARKPGHLVMEYFRLRAGFEAIHVPYRSNPADGRGSGGGQVKVGFVTTSGMMEHVQAGRLKGTGVSRASRSPLARTCRRSQSRAIPASGSRTTT